MSMGKRKYKNTILDVKSTIWDVGNNSQLEERGYIQLQFYSAICAPRLFLPFDENMFR